MESEKGLEVREQSRNLKRKDESQGKSRNLNRLSESKNSAIPYVQSECQFNQNTMSRSQEKFYEVREKSGKMKMEKVATLYDIRSYVRYVI